MTVGVAAICADWDGNSGQSAVVATDRMATVLVSGAGNVQTDDVLPKIEQVRRNVVALLAGDCARGRAFLAEIDPSLTRVESDVAALATRLAGKYADFRRKYMEPSVFGTRGIHLSDFYRRDAANMGEPLAAQIDKEAKDFVLNVELLMVGCSARGAQVFHIAYPGTATDLTETRFAAIGEGQMLSRVMMFQLDHLPSRSIAETVYAVYAARHLAARVAGVGAEGTDLAMVDRTSVQFLTAEEVSDLRVFHDEVRDESRRRIVESPARLPFLTTKPSIAQ